ncbi:MAG: lipopolysaccharide assembly protein LapA domain-containing protein [Sphingomonas sp.]
MQFLKTLFWVLLAIVIAVFAVGNWTTVPVKLWSGLIAEVNLPLLLLVSFLAGLLPTWLFHKAVHWRLKQRLQSRERSMDDLRVAAVAAAASQDVPQSPGDELSIPPASVMTAVPPGVA